MKRIAVAIGLLALLTGCSSSQARHITASPRPTQTSKLPDAMVVEAKNGCKGGTVHKDPSLDAPGCYAVSTMEPGKQFDTSANFFYFKKCGRPCWLPLYPSPILVPGKAVTHGMPCEYYLLKTATGLCQDGESQVADQIHVICQVRSTLATVRPGDDDLVDEADHHSNIWDQVYVPEDAVTGDTSGLQRAPDGKGYLAYGSDLWLQNTGWHGIPCSQLK